MFPVFGALKWNRIYIAAQATPLGPADIFRGHLMFMTMRIAMNSRQLRGRVGLRR